MSTRKLSSMNLNRVLSPVVRCGIGESSTGGVCATDICLRCKFPGEVNPGVDCDDSIEDELAVQRVEPVRTRWTTP